MFDWQLDQDTPSQNGQADVKQGTHSFCPSILVLLQLALVHLHVSQALPTPPR